VLLRQSPQRHALVHGARYPIVYQILSEAWLIRQLHVAGLVSRLFQSTNQLLILVLFVVKISSKGAIQKA